MVKVIPIELFVSGGLLPVSREPIAVASVGDLVVVATVDHVVSSFRGTDLVGSFRANDAVVVILHAEAIDALVTIEKVRVGR